MNNTCCFYNPLNINVSCFLVQFVSNNCCHLHFLLNLTSDGPQQSVKFAFCLQVMVEMRGLTCQMYQQMLVVIFVLVYSIVVFFCIQRVVQNQHSYQYTVSASTKGRRYRKILGMPLNLTNISVSNHIELKCIHFQIESHQIISNSMYRIETHVSRCVSNHAWKGELHIPMVIPTEAIVWDKSFRSLRAHSDY